MHRSAPLVLHRSAPRPHIPRRLWALGATVLLLAAGLGLPRAAWADNVPTVTVSDVTQLEGNAGTTPFVFAVALTQPSPVPVSVRAYTRDGSALAGADYQANQALFTFAPGQTSQTFTVQVNADQRYEGNRSFSVCLDSETSAQVATRCGTGEIIDDDPLPYVTVSPVTVSEGSTTATASFPVSLSSPSARTVKVGYSTNDSDAHAGIDYQATSGTLSIAAGQTSGVITVPVLGNSPTFGPTTSFSLNLRNPLNAQLIPGAGGWAYGTIIENRAPSSLTVNSVTVHEGNTGTTPATFTVTLYPPSPVQVTVDYATSDGSATRAENDYQATQGTLVFAPGQVTKTVTVPVVANTTNETPATEYFSLSLSGATNAGPIYHPTGTGTIIDDDPPVSVLPSISLNNVAVVLPGAGVTGHALLTASLSAPATSTVTASWGTSNWTATGGTDYTTTNAGLSFAPGQTTQTVDVPILGSALAHPDRAFFVNLSNATGATLLDYQGTVRIIDHNVAPTMSVSNPVAVETAGPTATMHFTVSLSAPSPNVVTVNYTTQDWSAVQGSDYIKASGTLTFSPGQTSASVLVSIPGDSQEQGDHRFFLYLSNPVNATVVQSQAVGTIADSYTNPTVSVGDTTVIEGTGVTTTALIPVTLSGPSPNPISVNYHTSDWSAAAPEDYLAQSGTLAFAPGQTTQTVRVPVVASSIQDGDESFFLGLSNPVNVDIQRYQGIARIIDDDINPWVSVDDASVTKPASGSAPAVFHVNLTSASLNTVTVNYATQDWGATQGTDYTRTSGTLTFNPGQTSLAVAVPVLGNTLPLGDRRFFLNLSSPVNANLETATGEGAIVDPNLMPQLSVGDTTALEPAAAGATTTMAFPVTLSFPTPNPITVNYATADWSATQGTDYQARSGTLTFAPNQTRAMVTATVLGDAAADADQAFLLNLSSPTNAAVLTSSGRGYIRNANPSPSPTDTYLTVSDSALAEGNAGTHNAAFVVTLMPPSATPVSVKYATNASSLLVNQVIAQTGTLNFAPGQTTQTVNVPIVGDTVVNGDQSFTLNLSNATGGAQVIRAGTGVILNDDHLAWATVNDLAVTAGNTGSVQAKFVVRLTAPSPQPVSIDWATQDGTARATGDYGDDAGTVTIPAGQLSQAVSVQVNSYVAWESPEYFSVFLSNATGATLLRTHGYAEIRGDIVSTIGGTILDGAGRPIPSAVVTQSGNALPNVAVGTSGGGFFTLPNVIDGQYGVSPTKAGFTFVPTSTAVNVVGQNQNLAFLGVTGTFISGRLTDSGGQPLAGATVIRTGGGQPTITALTNAAGYWGFSANPAGSYTLIPSLAGYAFNPGSRTVAITSVGVGGVNFQAG